MPQGRLFHVEVNAWLVEWQAFDARILTGEHPSVKRIVVFDAEVFARQR